MGHMDPAFHELTQAVSEQLRAVFRTENPCTIALPATGGSGPAVFADNFVEEGDRVVVGICGVFGERMAQAFERVGAEVVRVEGEWGRDIPPAELTAALGPEASVLAVVHGETSTGVVQEMDGLGAACREAGAILLVDCVTSLGGMPVEIDEWGVDAAFAGTQKCLNCPPGLAPFTAGPRALERLEERSRPPGSWYLDLSLIWAWWDPETRGAYHHTVPVNSIYGLHEALRLILDEGLEARWERHERAHRAMRAGLAVWDIGVLAPPECALWPLIAALTPEGVDADALRSQLLQEQDIETAAGFGQFAGRMFRIGLMGASARLESVEFLLEALADPLGKDPGPAIEAAREAFG